MTTMARYSTANVSVNVSLDIWPVKWAVRAPCKSITADAPTKTDNLYRTTAIPFAGARVS